MRRTALKVTPQTVLGQQGLQVHATKTPSFAASLRCRLESLHPRLDPKPGPLGTPAAVLATLFVGKHGDVRIWLLRRSDALRKHSGQVALPGGKFDLQDGSLLRTALREAYEEVGMLEQNVTLIGSLPVFPTTTGFRVRPFVALQTGPFEPVAQVSEVARVFHAPMSAFRGEGEPRQVTIKGVPLKVPSYAVSGEIVWGATAKIMRELAARLR